MGYGITDEGFIRKPLDAVLEDTNAAQRAVFGDEWDTSPAAPDGIMNGLDARQKDEIWQAVEAIYANLDPDKATGAALATVAALTGTTPLRAKRSVSAGTANLAPGTSVDAQALVISVSGNPAARFRNQNAITNPGGSAADVDVTWEAIETGPTVANTGTLTVIETPTTGVNSVNNIADAVLGRNLETPLELRLRRESELRKPGGAVQKAIKSDLDAVTGVSQALVYMNVTDSTVDGIPPHAVECVVFGGDDDVVAQQVFDSVGAGIATHGNTALTALDSEGDVQTVKFTRPTELPIYLTIVRTTAPGYGGDIAVKQAVALYGNQSFNVADDVVLARFYAAIFGVGGVADVSEIRIGLSPSPVSTANFSVDARSIARFDTSRIAVSP